LGAASFPVSVMRQSNLQAVRVESDHAYVEHRVDELIEQLHEHARGDTDRFTEMLAHFVSMSVAPSIAATNRVLHLPAVSEQNTGDRVKISVAGDSNYVNFLGKFETELVEALTNAVLQTLLGPSPRLSFTGEDDSYDYLSLN
jgi:hypothetical protein